MTIDRVKRAASIRGLFFDGKKCWRNSMIGYGYEIYTGGRFIQFDSLNGVYQFVMSIPKEADK